MRIARPDGTLAQVGELRIARSDSTVAKVGEMRIARPDGTIVPVWTSLPPAILLDTTLITSAGTHTITPPAGTGSIVAFLVGGGGGGGMSNSPQGTGQGGSHGEANMIIREATPTLTVTVGAGGAGSTAPMGGGAGSPGGDTTLSGWTAPGGAGGSASGSPVAGGEASGDFAAHLLPLTGGITTWTIGPGGKTDGQDGQLGGGGAGGRYNYMGGGAGGAGGDGWARIWFWTRDPRV